ncbi:MAG: aminoacyl-tRNA hydrolase [Bacteroidales bacterium]|jgi:PTH1 family peptidyl-tRNA hydrolase|nr:aminoacyl-tRNA hydrolase [Bacteroidales bacterium]
MKYLIAGLGNIGAEYINTRHNIGFTVLDSLSKESNTIFFDARLGAIAEIKNKGKQLLLLKPSTYMNLSGKAINYYLQKEKIPIENLFVIVDDLALPFGTIRIKSKGSSGGHNGLQHVEETLQSQDYARLRFGIGNEFSKGRQINYVLGNWSDEEKKLLPERIKIVTEAILNFSILGIDRTMNLFNNK